VVHFIHGPTAASRSSRIVPGCSIEVDDEPMIMRHAADDGCG
jgi:hypothetical protein